MITSNTDCCNFITSCALFLRELANNLSTIIIPSKINIPEEKDLRNIIYFHEWLFNDWADYLIEQLEYYNKENIAISTDFTIDYCKGFRFLIDITNIDDITIIIGVVYKNKILKFSSLYKPFIIADESFIYAKNIKNRNKSDIALQPYSKIATQHQYLSTIGWQTIAIFFVPVNYLFQDDFYSINIELINRMYTKYRTNKHYGLFEYQPTRF